MEKRREEGECFFLPSPFRYLENSCSNSYIKYLKLFVHKGKLWRFLFSPLSSPLSLLMSPNSKHPHLGAAKTRLKRVVQKGEPVAEKVAGKILGGSSEHDERNETSAMSIHWSYITPDLIETHGSMIDTNAAGRLIRKKSEVALDVMQAHEHPDERGSISLFAALAVLCICAGVLHALDAKDTCIFVLANSDVPLYLAVSLAAASFFVGRVFEVHFGNNRSSMIQHSKHVGFTTAECEETKNGEVTSDKLMQQRVQNRIQQQNENAYTQQLKNKLYCGKQKVKQYVHIIPNTFRSNLSLRMEEKLPCIHLSIDLMRHLLTYQDFSKSVAPAEIKQTASKAASFVEDISLGHCVLNNSEDASFEDEGFDYIVEPMCSLRGMDMFLADDPEVEIWKQPMLSE